MPDGPSQQNAKEQAGGVPSIELPKARPEKGEVPSGAPVERPRAEPTPAEAARQPAPVVRVAQPLVSKKSPLLQDIEGVLEEDLLVLYRALSQSQRKQFKSTGERTARNIETLLKKATVTIVEVIRLIRSWLRLLPGVNIFFIEKEAKIKAERILMLKKNKR